MDRLERIIKAKEFLTALSNSVDPTTGEKVYDSVISKYEVQETLAFAASLIEEIIECGGEIVKTDFDELSEREPEEFNAAKIDKSAIVVTDTPIQLTGFVSRINRQIDKNAMKKLKLSSLTAWLADEGYLKSDKVPTIKYDVVYSVSNSSGSIGIIEKQRIDRDTGEIKKTVALTRAAQQFIIDHLEAVSQQPAPWIKDKQKSEQPERAGYKWTREEELSLIRAFKDGKISLKQIAFNHSRTLKGVRLRLKKLGLIQYEFGSVKHDGD